MLPVPNTTSRYPCLIVVFRMFGDYSYRLQHYELKLKEMDEEVRRHEQEHERLLADLEQLEKRTEVVVKVMTVLWVDLA